ncbi:MAG TPA: A/G-specific adenine glycosylase [Acidimicrobiales bacterium]|nr:A/G-specific adenine glycosylase [Acidimicrobiales bacterium]
MAAGVTLTGPTVAGPGPGPVPGTGPDGRRLAAVARAVVRWGSANRRDLPWRATRDPWLVLVSEVMLQQTQADRVVGPYRRFVDRFPTAAACAAAGPAEVVRAWDGLGYNRRAVFLHRAAAAVVERHDGRIPADLDALLALPGIGAYTARAVLVFAFEADVGVVDTNVARLLARAVAGRPLRPAEAQELADRLVPTGRSWELNQSLFDLGARHCRSRRPDCAGCPLDRRCAWAATGWATPDPAVGSAATSRPQSRFQGSDRQGRGRLVAALRRDPVAADRLAAAAGWPDDPARSALVADALVADGLARWSGGRLHLA